MKRLTIIFILYSANIFAVEFETSLYATAGLQFTLYDMQTSPKVAIAKPKGFIGTEAGILGNLGANFDVPNYLLKNISALIDFGYTKTSFSASDDYLIITEFFDIIWLGFLGKLNFNKNYSFGIGAGAAFPLYSCLVDDETSNIQTMNYKDIKNNYTSIVMPYIKLTFDGRRHFTERFSFMYGVSLSYNFGFKSKPTSREYYNGSEYINLSVGEKISAFNLSVFVGVSFGRHNYNKA